MARVIVSLTTTADRIHLSYYSIKSILWQSRTPDTLLVNLSRHPHLNDGGVPVTPAWLSNEPVTVRCVENTGPYRKLLPALSFAESKDIVVTADDDILYQRHWLEALMDLAQRHPGAIVCGKARRMTRTVWGGWQNYQSWPAVTRQATGQDLLPVGCHGVVYRKDNIDLDFLYDRQFLRLAPRTDDLWFRMASYVMRTPVVVDPDIGWRNHDIKHRSGLAEGNAEQRKKGWRKLRRHTVGRIKSLLGVPDAENDRAWRAIVDYASRQHASGGNTANLR